MRPTKIVAIRWIPMDVGPRTVWNLHQLPPSSRLHDCLFYQCEELVGCVAIGQAGYYFPEFCQVLTWCGGGQTHLTCEKTTCQVPNSMIEVSSAYVIELTPALSFCRRFDFIKIFGNNPTIRRWYCLCFFYLLLEFFTVCRISYTKPYK